MYWMWFFQLRSSSIYKPRYLLLFTTISNSSQYRRRRTTYRCRYWHTITYRTRMLFSSYKIRLSVKVTCCRTIAGIIVVRVARCNMSQTVKHASFSANDMSASRLLYRRPLCIMHVSRNSVFHVCAWQWSSYVLWLFMSL